MTHIERFEQLFKDVDYHGIYTVEAIQKKLDDAGFKVKLSKSWKVTKSFLKDVQKGGGWCNIAVGTPIIDGSALSYVVLHHFKLTNPESFGGHGRQYHSDLAVIRAEMERLDALDASSQHPGA